MYPRNQAGSKQVVASPPLGNCPTQSPQRIRVLLTVCDRSFGREDQIGGDMNPSYKRTEHAYTTFYCSTS
ncbi:hypothetical protein CALCODRAFT_495579, partial [Calocera cornea HHB12733]